MQMFTLISLVFGIILVICTVIILVDAFKKSLLKGFFCLLCGIYYIYFALVEFEHPNKFWVVVGSLLSGGVAGAMSFLHH